MKMWPSFRKNFQLQGFIAAIVSLFWLAQGMWTMIAVQFGLCLVFTLVLTLLEQVGVK